MGEEVIEIKKSELESLIEKKVSQEMNKRDSSNFNCDERPEGNISRREFLKKSGLGALGLGALLSPVSGLSVKDSSFDVFTGSSSSDLTNYLSVGQGGPVNIQNTSLNLNNQSISNVNQINGRNANNIHSRYTDSEASNAAPVQSVAGSTGNVLNVTTISKTAGDGDGDAVFSVPSNCVAWTFTSSSANVNRFSSSDGGSYLYLDSLGSTIAIRERGISGDISPQTFEISFLTL